MSVLKRKSARPEAICALISAMQACSKTAPELVEETGLSLPTVINWLRAAHGARLIYIAAWSNDRNTTAHYAWGRGTDAARPPVMSPAQRMAKHRQAKKNNM